MAQVVEHLPSKCEALVQTPISPPPHTQKKDGSRIEQSFNIEELVWNRNGTERQNGEELGPSSRWNGRKGGRVEK